jgi:hypothetical protein
VLRQANAASQVYYYFSHEPRDASFREQYREECKASWAEFYEVPGTRLTFTRSDISADDGAVLMTRRQRTWTELSCGRAFRFRLGAGIVDVGTGDQVLIVSGGHRGFAADTTVKRGQGPWLWFPVRGTSIADAVMTAIDLTGTEILRFRQATGKTQVVVSPEHAVTSDILCVIAIVGPQLASFFVPSG